MSDLIDRKMTFVAVSAATLGQIMMGALWYSPYFFGATFLDCAFPHKTRQQAIKDIENDTSSTNKAYAWAVSSAILGNITLISFLQIAPTPSHKPILVTMGVMIALSSVPHYAFLGYRAPLYFIDQGHNLARLAIGYTAYKWLCK